MFATYASRAIRVFGSLGAALVLAALPCLAWSQAGVQKSTVSPAANITAGVVNSLSGSVSIRRGTGGQVPAKVGDPVERGTTISTGAGAEVVVLFADGQHLSLNANAVLRVEEYQFDARNITASRVDYALLDGMMRVVTGTINASNPDAMRITAGDATIRVRSKGATSFAVEADTKVARETGSVAVVVGEVSVLRPNKTTIRVAADQFTRWQPALSPEQAYPLGAAPAYLQAMASFGAAPLVVQAGPQKATATIVVNSFSGIVSVRNAGGAEAAAKVGDVLGTGSVVRTGPTGEAVLLFPDGQYLTLTSDSVLRIDDYRFDANDLKASRLSLGLASGMMRIVTGSINAANPGAMRITAGDAVIGVRSANLTSFVVESDTKFGPETGSVAVIVGEVAVVRPDKSTVRVDTEHFTRWQPRVFPEEPMPVAAAPAYLQAMAAAGVAPVVRESTQAMASAGVVNSVSGVVLMRNGAGIETPAKVGDVVSVGSIVSTGSDGEVVVLFADGQHLSLSSESALRVDEYRFDTRDSAQNRSSFTLVAGTMQVVTGAIQSASPDVLRISAGDALIGVLGREVTSFVVESEARFSRETGSIAVITGEVFVLRPDKTTVKVVTDQYLRWKPLDFPEEPKALATAPEDLKSAIAASRPASQVQDVPQDVEAAVQLALETLPPSAAGPEVQAQPEPTAPAAELFPPVTPGTAGGCVGSPC